jgi:ARG/rhodanese/phosphatase superfamily protein
MAVNGKVNSADIYPSNGLFRKMWPKMLRASVTEAIGERDAANAPAPPAAAVSGFINPANNGRVTEARAGERTRIRVMESPKVMSLESRPAAPAAAWLHRSYIAK